MRRWNSRVSYFIFLSCLWEGGMLTGSSLYAVVEVKTQGIGLVDVLIY